MPACLPARRRILYGANLPMLVKLAKSRHLAVEEGIEGDLRNERPKWPFSAYGPGRDAPLQLFGGFPLEQSPEEMRVLYYQAIASGNPQPAVSDTGFSRS